MLLAGNLMKPLSTGPQGATRIDAKNGVGSGGSSALSQIFFYYTFSINDKSTLISCTLGTRGTGNYYIYCQEPAEKKTNEENERRRGKGKECKMGSNYNLILDISASMICINHLLDGENSSLR